MRTGSRFDGTALYEHLDPREGVHREWNTYIYNLGRNEVRGFLIGSGFDYVGGQTLQERLAVLGPEALAKTFADVLNAISKDAATAVIKSIYQNVTHDIDLQAD